MQLIEITWNSDASAQLISQLRSGITHLYDWDWNTVNPRPPGTSDRGWSAIHCSPHINSAMIQAAAQSVPIVPGALSTEIVSLASRS